MSGEQSLAFPGGGKKARRIYNAIRGVLRQQRGVSTGGCRAFYSPAQWASRGEEYGTRSEFVVVYDGGDLGSYFDLLMGDEARLKAMSDALFAEGFYFESCTCWYGAVYPI